jgi:hypothetical protein
VARAAFLLPLRQSPQNLRSGLLAESLRRHKRQHFGASFTPPLQFNSCHRMARNGGDTERGEIAESTGPGPGFCTRAQNRQGHASLPQPGRIITQAVQLKLQRVK